MIETRNSWLSLLNFMRFLRRGPSGSSPRKTRLGCPVLIVKARYGVLRVNPALRAGTCAGYLLGTAGALRAAVRNGGDGRGLRVRGEGRVLRVHQSAGGRAQFKSRYGAVDAAAEIVGGIQKVIGGWVDADGDGFLARGVGSETGQRPAAQRVGRHRVVQGVGHINKGILGIGNNGGGLIPGREPIG